MDISPLRRHSLLLGTLAAAVGFVASVGVVAAWTAVDDGPKAPQVEAELRFGPEDNEQPLVTPDRTGEAAPTDSFLTLEGRPASLADYRGEALVVNFFGSWCVPCRKETPALEALHRQLGDKVRFLGLAIHDSQRSAKAFVDEMGVTYDVGRDTSDTLFQALGGVTAPSTYLISPDGHVVARHVGAVGQGQLRTLLREKLAIQ